MNHFKFEYGDYSWRQIIKDPYTIDNADGNIDNVDNISSILALDNVTSSGVPADGQVLKWNGSSWYVADDNESSTSLDGGLLRNVEVFEILLQTLTWHKQKSMVLLQN